jgi:succinate dehydrogenase / fumarate reductase iron-sulfur subunit
MIDCSLCGSCYSSCNLTELDKEYSGPAALMKANRFLQDSRDTATAERLNLVDGDHGVWRCHTIFNCQEVCPKDLNPAGGIAMLKREAIRQRSRD